MFGLGKAHGYVCMHANSEFDFRIKKSASFQSLCVFVTFFFLGLNTQIKAAQKQTFNLGLLVLDGLSP